MSTTTANMGIAVPAVGDSDYPTSISAGMGTIDLHDHTSTKGVQIPTGGIVDLAVTTAKIAALNVTDAKLAANSVITSKILDANVTRAKLEAVGQQISASCGTFTTSATVATDVTNLTVTITTTGRPVMLGLMPDGSTVNHAQIKATDNAAANAEIDVLFLEGATVIGLWKVVSDSAGDLTTAAPASAFMMLRPVAAGTYTYKVQTLTNAISPDTVSFLNIKLYAYEL